MRNTPHPHNRLPRRDFLKQASLSALAGTMLAANVLVAMLPDAEKIEE